MEIFDIQKETPVCLGQTANAAGIFTTFGFSLETEIDFIGHCADCPTNVSTLLVSTYDTGPVRQIYLQTFDPG